MLTLIHSLRTAITNTGLSGAARGEDRAFARPQMKTVDGKKIEESYEKDATGLNDVADKSLMPWVSNGKIVCFLFSGGAQHSPSFSFFFFF